MELPRYCRDCCFRAGENDIYGCAYALLTGRTRMAQPAGTGCTYKIKGERYREDTVPKDLMTALKRKREPPKPVKKCVLPGQKEPRKKRGCTKIRETACMELYRSGLSDAKIAAELGVTPGAITNWRRRNELKAMNTNHREGAEQMARQKTVQKFDTGTKTMEPEKETPWAGREQLSTKELRDWARKEREEKEKLQADLAKATARGDALETENRQLRQEQQNAKDTCGKKNESTGPVMALPVLTELLQKIAGEWPNARLSGNPGACRALVMQVTYGVDGKEQSVEGQLLS